MIANQLGTKALVASIVLGLFAIAEQHRGHGFRHATAIEASAAKVIDQRDLLFEHGADGRLAIVDPGSHTEVDVLFGDDKSFIRVTVKGLERARRALGITENAPLRLTRWSDGRLSLDDSLSGQRIELVAFGRTNMMAFSELLSKGRGKL
jgi:putative photosynthetic complex assembly protein